MTVGEKIKFYREARGMTQEMLAKTAGISLSGLKKYEGNSSVPKPEFLEKVARALNISPLILKDITPETIGEFAHYFFALAEIGDIQIHGSKDSATGKYNDDLTFSFSSSSLMHYLKEWADGKAIIDGLRQQANESPDEIAKEMLLKRADEIQNALELKIQDSTILIKK